MEAIKAKLKSLKITRMNDTQNNTIPLEPFEFLNAIQDNMVLMNASHMAKHNEESVRELSADMYKKKISISVNDEWLTTFTKGKRNLKDVTDRLQLFFSYEGNNALVDNKPVSPRQYRQLVMKSVESNLKGAWTINDIILDWSSTTLNSSLHPSNRHDTTHTRHNHNTQSTPNRHLHSNTQLHENQTQQGAKLDMIQTQLASLISIANQVNDNTRKLTKLEKLDLEKTETIQQILDLHETIERKLDNNSSTISEQAITYNYGYEIRRSNELRKQIVNKGITEFIIRDVSRYCTIETDDNRNKYVPNQAAIISRIKRQRQAGHKVTTAILIATRPSSYDITVPLDGVIPPTQFGVRLPTITLQLNVTDIDVATELIRYKKDFMNEFDLKRGVAPQESIANSIFVQWKKAKIIFGVSINKWGKFNLQLEPRQPENENNAANRFVDVRVPKFLARLQFKQNTTREQARALIEEANLPERYVDECGQIHTVKNYTELLDNLILED